MSINCVYEFLIHFHTYKNIDLINQGLYQIKSNISYTLNNKVYYAVPYYFTESKDLETLSMTEENEIKPHSVINNSICENGFDYKTKSFVIRYADEEVELDEFCYFRLEVPKKLNNKDLNFICNFSLEFSDVLSSQSKDLKNGLFHNIKFKPIQTSKININNSRDEYYCESFSPVIYKDSFSSLLDLSIHKILIDYRVRLYPNLLPFSIEDGSSTNFFGNNEPTNKKDLQKGQNSNDTSKNKSENKTNIENFTVINAFLEEKEIPNFLGKNVIDNLYNNYVLSLIDTYIAIKTRFSELSFRLIDDDSKSDYSSFSNIQPLVIYSEEKEENILVDDENFQSNLSKVKDFSGRINDFSKDYVGFRILQEISFISSQIGYIWHKYIELIRTFPGPSNFIFMSDFKKNLQKE